MSKETRNIYTQLRNLIYNLKLEEQEKDNMLNLLEEYGILKYIEGVSETREKLLN